MILGKGESTCLYSVDGGRMKRDKGEEIITGGISRSERGHTLLMSMNTAVILIWGTFTNFSIDLKSIVDLK